MTRLSDALETRTALAQEIHATRDAQVIVDPGDETSRPMEGWEASQDLAEHLITEGWVLGRPGEIPESQTLEVGPTGDGGARMSWPAPPVYLQPGPMTLEPQFSESTTAVEIGPREDPSSRLQYLGHTYARHDTAGLLDGNELVARIQRLLTGVTLSTSEANAILAAVAARTSGETAAVAGLHPWDSAPDVFDELRQEQRSAREKYPLEHDVVHGVQHVIGEAYTRLGNVTSEATPKNRQRLVVVGGLIGSALQVIDSQGTFTSDPTPAAS